MEEKKEEQQQQQQQQQEQTKIEGTQAVKVVTLTLEEIEKRRKQIICSSTKRNHSSKKPSKQEKNKIKRDKKKFKKQLQRQFNADKNQDKHETEEERQKREQSTGRIEDRKKRKQIYVEKMQTAPRVVVDFQFVDQTWERDRASLMKQIEVCHMENQKFENPLKLTCSRSDHEQMQKHMTMRNCDKWGIDLEPKDILEAYNKEDIIYMSGDVDIDMGEYEPDKIYIIGGLVEHNRLVNLTKDYCAQNGIKARRLPLSRYLDLKACSLLNINHVFSILLKLHNGWTWEKAITTSVPSRKIGYKLFSDDESDEEQKKNQLGTKKIQVEEAGKENKQN